MLKAITRAISPKMSECELTHLPRQPIDIELAKQQHDDYVATLTKLGCEIIQVSPAPDLPDSVFVEDCCLVLDELAIICRPGAESRRPETKAFFGELQAHRDVRVIESPGILDGGDVLVLGKQIFVGLSSRSNEEAIRQIEEIVYPQGYEVKGVEVTGCLHLKSAATKIGEQTVLLNPNWIDKSIFSNFEFIETHPDEPGAANGLLVNGTVLFPVDFPKTAMRLAEAGIEILLLDNSEVMKAEGALTCCSVVFK